MPRPPQISDAESEVMKVLWDDSPLTGSEVAERMSAHPKTVKTLLGRLVKKGALKYREEGNRFLYRPAFPREQYVAAESRSFLERVFSGDAAPAVIHFVENVKLSDDDIRELRDVLERRARGGKE
ncbi:MAG: BlaI/MecI/CopY family transcriptional regulator [Thermoanaerobaculia bacterium]